MELTSITLRNFRTHRNASFDFTSGVTAIIGGNGSGKSSIVEAIIFLLTGEGYGKTKTEMLTVGETSGWVVGKLLIDGKEAILERHIDAAKVNFVYDGKTYKKSGEVNEIWDKLFQIDKNIVQNVIVSNQGEIALLFNGDNATREKLFQKIFMVPNTTKIRDVIWNNYIKDAPPEYPIKDMVELNSSIQCVEQTILMSNQELSSLVFDEADYNELITRRAYLLRVEETFGKHEVLLKELSELEQQASAGKEASEAVRNKMAQVNIQDYRTAAAEQRSFKKLFDSKNELLARKKSLIPPKEQIDREYVNKLHSATLEIEAELKSKRTKVAELNQRIAEYEKSGLASGTCPTCGTRVDNVVKLIEHLEKEREPIIQAGKAQKEELLKMQDEYVAGSKLVQQWDEYNSATQVIDQTLAGYANLDYNQEALDLYETVIVKYDAWETQLSSLSKSVRDIEDMINRKNVQIAALTVYDKDPLEFNTEKAAVNSSISEAQKVQETRKRLEIELATNNRDLKNLQRDLEDNKNYIEKNDKRNQYVSILKSVYDLFHTGKFPRALIQTYSSTVTEYMNEVLASFDFPYSARVNETFGIDIFNEEGLELPAISGGQQVMVGFSLRLALHNMFVGAFPFMIVDEGSYGLNTENAKKYFEIIRSLGKSSKFKQVIVIDHHHELSEYVDNTITL